MKTCRPHPDILCRPTSEPFLVFVEQSSGGTKRDVEFLDNDGTLTNEPEEAAQYVIVAGQLRSIAGHVSTSGLVPFQVFAASPFSLPVSRTFSMLNGSLEWINDGFYAGKARFCLLNTTVNVDFSGQPPTACRLIELGTVPAQDALRPPETTSTTETLHTTVSSDTTVGVSGASTTIPYEPQSSSDQSTTRESTAAATASVRPPLPAQSTVTGQLATAQFFGCLRSGPEDLVIPGRGHPVATLEECVDYCAGSDISNLYAGVQFSMYTIKSDDSPVNSHR